MLILYFDGLCEPRNPGGWACYGWLIKHNGMTVASGQGLACRPGLGSTNNVAEYAALIAGLEALAGLDMDVRNAVRNARQGVEVRGDSSLVINQVTGAWACNAVHLRPFCERARALAHQVGWPAFRWVPREQNTEADELSRRAYAEARQAPATR